MGPFVVSIGLPVYNGEPFLAQALDSLLAQSFEDFELIISDNASTDRTRSLCESYQKRDPRVQYFRQSVNMGPVWNFNFVVRQAAGKYFMWAAHDDLWDREWIATLLRNFGGRTAISFGNVAVIGADGRGIKIHGELDFTGPRLSRLVRYFLADEHHGKANLIYGLYLTETIRDIGLVTYPGCDFGQDMHTVFDCLQRGDIRSDPAVLLHKRVVSNAPGARTAGAAVRAVFLLDRIRYYFSYILIARHGVDKAVLAALLPVKYIAAGVLNAYYALQLRLGLLFERKPPS